MNKRSLDVLDKLTGGHRSPSRLKHLLNCTAPLVAFAAFKTLSTSHKRRFERADELMWRCTVKDPESKDDDDWYMAVLPCFNDALDIKWNFGGAKTGWTQSGCFSFKAADMLYDTYCAYEVWSEALKHTNLAVQIETASSAGQGDGGTRFPGSVLLSYLTPDPDRTKIIRRGTHSMTQDEFVRFLIAGPADELKAKIQAAQQDKSSVSATGCR